MLTDNRGSSDVVEGPRVERMQPESGTVNCGSGNCVTLRNSDAPLGGLWFGPRLGRRRRSDKKMQALGEMLASGSWVFSKLPSVPINSLTIADQKSLDYNQPPVIYKSLRKNCTKPISTGEQGSDGGISGQREGMTSNQQQPQDDKRQETTFTPRLGRELDDIITSVSLVRSLLERADALSRKLHPERMIPRRMMHSEWDGKRAQDFLHPDVRAKLERNDW
ncbi:hypothetical protein QAD02_012199 [Eretmocerus hayati]|uniref:Uncharacterized protein n=1 Tax=Eretmocerus hayati TaxID=131215 RepID=A0ACC2NZ48_9HYME|nr:hypothetical protein QAD02_012199 [Eretmocerus hayati]